LETFGGGRDCTKFQIYFSTPPSVEEGIFISCYHCSNPITREVDNKYVVVAGAFQRPIYFHEEDCYDQFLDGMIIFYHKVVLPNRVPNPEPV
jgi:hypothetical protein